ncbi:MAG: MMPL family transporter [Gammaproteobacteria bacterium]|nr:MMPL family transporter [Gammaproteobacteria bacterium]
MDKFTRAIDNFSVKWSTWVLNHRWLTIFLSLVIVGAIFSQSVNLNFSTNYRVFFSEENPDLVAFEEFQKTYTKSDNFLFVIQHKDEKRIDGELAEIAERITEEAWQIPYATRVDSITNFQHTWANGDDLTVEDLIKDGRHLAPNVLDSKVDIALKEPLLNNFFISKDADTTSINVVLQYPEKDLEEVPIAANYARSIVAGIEKDFPNINIALSGVSMLNNSFAESGLKDMQTLTPIMYAVLLIITFLSLRSISATFATLVVIILSTLVSLGAGGMMHVLLTPISLTAPTIVLTLAIADSIHILISMRELMRTGMEKNKALIEGIRINFLAVTITSITTIVGFLSLNFSDSPPYHHLGNMTAAGIAAAWGLSLFMLPAVISLLPMKIKNHTKESVENSFYTKLANFVILRPKSILLATGSIAIIFSALAFTNQLNDVWTKYFDESIKFRKDTDFALQHLGAFYPVEFSIPSKESGGISHPEYLQKLDEFAQWMRAQPDVEHVYSITDIFKRLNKNMHGDDERYFRLPEDNELSAQYLLLYELSLPYGLDLNDRINVDKSATRITATLGDVDTIRTREFVVESRQWLQDNTPEYMWASATGPTQMFSYIAKRNIESMLRGNAMAVSIIAIILIFSLRSFRLGLLSIIPNAIPVLVTFGIWALTVGVIGMAAATITATSLGIVVDDTVHLLTKYLRGRREKDLNTEDSIRYSLNTVGKAITINTVILAIGFSVLAFSSFKLNQEAGILTATAVVIALILDFLLLPALLLVVDKNKKNIQSAQAI